jgi:hypothetical protein
MADIRLISLLPPPPVQGIQASQVSQGSNPQTPPALTSLASGTILSGFIINRDNAGNPILRTDSGDVTFASNFFLKIGSEVVIRVDNSGGNSLAQILSVDGQPPEVAEKTSGFARQPEVIVTPSYRPPNPLVTLNATLPANSPPPAEADPAITVFGTLIKPAKQATASSPAASLPSGTQLTLRLISLNVAVHPAAEEALLAQTPHAPSSPQVNPSYYAAYARATGAPTPPASSTVAAAPVHPELGNNSITVSPTTLPPGANTAQPVLPQSMPLPAAGGLKAEMTPLPLPAQPIITPTVPQIATASPAAPLENAITVAPQIPMAALPAASPTPLPATVVPATAPAPIPAVAAPPGVSQPANPLPQALSALVANPPPAASPASVPVMTVSGVENASTVTSVASGNLLSGQIVTATVLGSEPTGEALLQTPAGVVRLQPGTVVPSGSVLTLQIVQTTPPSFSTLNSALNPSQSLPNAPAPMKELAQQWTSLQQVYALLAERFALLGVDYIPVGLPGVAAENTQPGQATLVPQSMTTGLLLFLASLRGGDFRNWLGRDNAGWLEDQGHANLVKRAEKEFASIAQNYAEAKPGQWQSLFFPVAVENHIQQVRMFLKRDRKQGGSQQEKTSEDTRFVIEVDLSHLGEMQIDGFVRKLEKDINFDMIIRSLTPIPKEFQDDILRIYTATGAITGYRGSLVFQPVKEFPVNPIQDIIAAQDSIVA